MSERRFSESWRLLDTYTGKCSWEECYAIGKTDWVFLGDTDESESTGESESHVPRENDFPVREDHYTPASSSSLRFHSCCDVTPSLPSTSTPEQHSAPRSMSRTEANRRHRRAAASHPYHARGCDRERAPASTEHRCCHDQEYRPQSIMSRRARLRRSTTTPNLPSWQHLPVTIEPEKWYEVVGSMQCEYCKAMGRHQKTSWICQLCQVPLCLMPFRNCYSVWHGQNC